MYVTKTQQVPLLPLCSALTSSSPPGLRQLALKSTAIEKFLYLSTLRKNNVHLFYRLVVDHLKVNLTFPEVSVENGGARANIIDRILPR